MRIIAGIARGMSLAVPRGGHVRPTSDRVRGAVFSSLGDRVVGATVLDLFAGTGALGLEAASRGANAVMFAESASGALKILQQNVAAFSRGRTISCELVVIRAEALAHVVKLAAAQKKFSLIFADPPYGEAAQSLLGVSDLPEVLDHEGLFVLESGKRDALAALVPWRLMREAVYGDTRVSFFAAH
jgi:16S rRNA (guanine(966)-N(2))-methyltransferase RsmD